MREQFNSKVCELIIVSFDHFPSNGVNDHAPSRWMVDHEVSNLALKVSYYFIKVTLKHSQ